MIKESKKENSILTEKNSKYEMLIEGNGGELISAREQILNLNNLKRTIESEISEKKNDLELLIKNIAEKRDEYIELDEAVLLQSFGLYCNRYNYKTSIEYRNAIEIIRNRQKNIIKSNSAAICTKIWSLEGSSKKGESFTQNNIKQIIRTFNIECDDIIKKVKFSNYEMSKKRILKSYDSLNKLNEINKIFLQKDYCDCKIDELDLIFEYIQKVEDEKENIRRQRELRREELQLAKELEEKRIEIEKEKQHYNNAMERLKIQILSEQNDERLAVLREKELEICNNLQDLDIALKDLDYREANKRAGYVYIISNIGTFGENVYKIGMTRRLEPQERIDELSGASVPFKFDVHAMVFSDDAPKLEAELHQKFSDKRVNVMNNRKEFFKVSLDEIKDVMKSMFNGSVEFTNEAEAEQYRETIKYYQNNIYIK